MVNGRVVKLFLWTTYSDTPFDPEKGAAYIRWTIETIDSLENTAAEPYATYEGNARRLLKMKG